MAELIRFPLDLRSLRGIVECLDKPEPTSWALSPALESGCSVALLGDGTGQVTVVVNGPDR